MVLGVDHVVIAVLDLERAVDDYRALGFTVGIGGRHPGRPTRNALVVFEDGAYLELIAWTAPAPAEHRYQVLARSGEGLVDFALLPEDTAKAIESARSRGLAMDGPIDGARVRPDGREIKWRSARQATFDMPFLCGDVTPRELRVPTGEIRRHANGAVGIARVSVAVRDLDASLTRYRALLGEAKIDRGAREASIALGETSLLLEPQVGDRGEGARALAIRTSLPERAGPLDLALTHQVPIELVPAISRVV